MAENENALAGAPETGGAGTTETEAQGEAMSQPDAPADAQEQEQQQTESEPAAAVPPEEISYHAVEKDGQVTALWEMQGRKHLRTIDPRSRLGQEILRHYTADHPEETA
jgi:hypothetical protein